MRVREGRKVGRMREEGGKEREKGGRGRKEGRSEGEEWEK